MYTMYAYVRNVCLCTQCMPVYAMYAYVHNVCLCTQCMPMYTMYACVHNVCLCKQSFFRCITLGNAVDICLISVYFSTDCLKISSLLVYKPLRFELENLRVSIRIISEYNFFMLCSRYGMWKVRASLDISERESHNLKSNRITFVSGQR
jgi:hypothetical protein